jgi:hypothetical protein
MQSLALHFFCPSPREIVLLRKNAVFSSAVSFI